MDKRTRNQVLSDMEAQLAGRGDPGERIRQALARDELTLYCQPVLELAIGSFPMAEVLVRMREEEQALLPPGDFLPLFEQYGLMPELDLWVVRNVIRHISRGSRVRRFSINVSRQSLIDEGFPAAVAVELVSKGVSGTTLLFEIDDADSLARLPAAKRFARGVKAAGCGLVLDGFGRRSHSFDALEALGVEFVKVDGSIVRKLLTSRREERKLRAIQKVGDALGFRLIAEMVEDQDILVRLKAMGVTCAQGFGIREPHPLDLLARWPADSARAG